MAKKQNPSHWVNLPSPNIPSRQRARVTVRANLPLNSSARASRRRPTSARPTLKKRGDHIEALEKRIHLMKLQARRRAPPQSQQRQRPKARVAQRASAQVSEQEIQRFLRSPAYNKAFAGGHQSSGIVPLPAMSAGKQPRAYMPCKGTISMTASIGPGATLVIGFNPYSRHPICGVYDLGAIDDHGTNWRQDYTVLSDASGPLQGFLTDWVGVTDPRTLVSGYEGNYVDEFDPADGNAPLILQQFMGGAFNCSITAGFNTTGRVGIVDSKSFPTLYGTKLTPVDTVNENSDGLQGSGYVNLPDTEDAFQWFRPNDYFKTAAPSDVLNAVQNTMIVGGSETSSTHVAFNLVPEGTRWAAWCGHYVPGVAAGCNATIGGVPAYNWTAYAESGMPLLLIANDGVGASSPITLRYTAQLFYNVHIPTFGGKAVPVLAAAAPVTRPHPADATSIHSVPMLSHTSTAHATQLHVAHSINSSRNSGLEDAHMYITAPPIVAPCTASKATGAAESGAIAPLKSLVGGLLKNVSPKDILTAVDKPETLLNKIDPSKLLSDPASLVEGIASIF